MEDLIKSLGVKFESMIMSLFVATIIFMLRIFEPATPPSSRKIAYLACAALATALLVPGLVVYWMKVDNAYLTGVYTAIVILSFEGIIAFVRENIIKKLKSKTDGDVTNIS